MRNVIALIFLAIGVTTSVAVITTYALAEGAQAVVVVAELLICLLGAVICGSVRH
jgi:hypothetical protein